MSKSARAILLQTSWNWYRITSKSFYQIIEIAYNSELTTTAMLKTDSTRNPKTNNTTIKMLTLDTKSIGILWRKLSSILGSMTTASEFVETIFLGNSFQKNIYLTKCSPVCSFNKCQIYPSKESIIITIIVLSIHRYFEIKCPLEETFEIANSASSVESDRKLTFHSLWISRKTPSI